MPQKCTGNLGLVLKYIVAITLNLTLSKRKYKQKGLMNIQYIILSSL